LSDCKEEGIHTLIGTFVEGLRDEEIKKEMRGETAARKDLTMEKIMELAGRQQIKMEASAESDDKKALKEGRERVVAPVISIQLDMSMCQRIVQEGSRQPTGGPGTAPMQQRIGGMGRMLMQNRMGSISKITHPVIFHSNSTCYNCGTPGHHTAECQF